MWSLCLLLSVLQFPFETNFPLHHNWYQSKDFYLDLMFDDGSSGKWTIDNEQWFEKIKQQLNEIDKTLRNLTWMVVALTIKGKCEPMEQQLDQHGDWQEDGYNDWLQPQIGLEIDCGGAICTSPAANHYFCECYPLRVYERRNQGALRYRDDDNLQRGVFDEQDEFCPPFQDGDDFQLPHRRNIQQRQ